MKDDTIIALAVAGAVVIVGYKVAGGVSTGLQAVGIGLGSGINEALSGAGGALRSSGAGVQAIGEGVGYGVGELGEGLGTGFAGLGSGIGAGVENVGAGVYEIGKGTGYALSGANIQDIIQTIAQGLTGNISGGEASAYKVGNQATLRQETATSQGNVTASSFVQTQQSVENIIGVVRNQYGGYSPITTSGEVLPMSMAPSEKTPFISGGSSLTGNAVQSIIPTTNTQVPTPRTATFQGLPITFSKATTPTSSSFISKVGSFLRKTIFI